MRIKVARNSAREEETEGENGAPYERTHANYVGSQNESWVFQGDVIKYVWSWRELSLTEINFYKFKSLSLETDYFLSVFEWSKKVFLPIDLLQLCFKHCLRTGASSLFDSSWHKNKLLYY